MVSLHVSIWQLGYWRNPGKSQFFIDVQGPNCFCIDFLLLLICAQVRCSNLVISHHALWIFLMQIGSPGGKSISSPCLENLDKAPEATELWELDLGPNPSCTRHGFRPQVAA